MRRFEVGEVGARKIAELALIGVRALLENNNGVRGFAPFFRVSKGLELNIDTWTRPRCPIRSTSRHHTKTRIGATSSNLGRLEEALLSYP